MPKASWTQFDFARMLKRLKYLFGQIKFLISSLLPFPKSLMQLFSVPRSTGGFQPTALEWEDVCYDVRSTVCTVTVTILFRLQERREEEEIGESGASYTNKGWNQPHPTTHTLPYEKTSAFTHYFWACHVARAHCAYVQAASIFKKMWADMVARKRRT